MAIWLLAWPEPLRLPIKMMGIVAVAAPPPSPQRRLPRRSRPPVGKLDRPPMGRRPPASSPPGPQGHRLYRRHERHHRIPLWRGSIRSAARAGRRSRSPTGRHDRRDGRPVTSCREGSDPDNSSSPRAAIQSPRASSPTSTSLAGTRPREYSLDHDGGEATYYRLDHCQVGYEIAISSSGPHPAASAPRMDQ
jgi:hypothetical protein